VSSDILPLVTHPEVSAVFNWQDDIDILNKLSKIKEYVTLKQLRISMHPDQYTVLNAVNQSVYESALTNLEYHADFLTYIGGSDLILHVGGVYGDKASAMTRFVERYRVLPEKIKNLLRLENDDKSYTIHDVLAISEQTGVSVIFDFHHHRCHHEYPLDEKTIKRIMSSWIGIPKCHMSSGRSMDTDRAHHDYIQLNDLLEMEKLFKPYLYDLMIEAKKKEMALIELRSAYETQSISQ
jgi:UV DNA damage endonuclease